MTEHIIDGRVIARQQLLALLRDVCTGAAGLCDNAMVASNQWEDSAKSVSKSCVALQRGLVNSHPQLADELHILSTEIQIAFAARSDERLFAARLKRIQAATRRLQQFGTEPERTG